MIDFLATDLIFQPFKLTRNRIQHVINAALPDTYPDRNLLKYLLTIQVPDYPGSNTYVDLITIPNREKPPVVEGTSTRYDGASFVFDSLLDGLLKRNKPTYRLSTIAATAQLTIPYRLIETVQYNGSTAYTNNLPASWAMKMGLTESDFDQWGTRVTSTYQATNRKFLTWQPNNKYITATQEEYLYFLLNFTPTPSTIKLRVKAIYTDASEQLLTPMELSGVQFGQVVCVPVGAYLMGFNASKTLQSYQVWLSNQDNDRLSEIRTFHLDYRVFAQERGLLFSNSFSCFDTLRLTGISTEALQVKRYSAYREKPLYQPADFTEFYVVDRAGGREITISTGFFERNVAATLRYFDELLLTEECYLITDRNHEPLELLTNTLVDHNDNPDLVARQFTFRYVREQKSFSFLPASPPFESRPTYWKANGIVQVLDGFGKRTGFVRPVKIVKTYLDDDTPVIPYTVKANTVGDPDYINMTFDSGIVVGSTPYPNVRIERNTTFSRQGCPGGYFGRPANVIIPAGKYGGEAAGVADGLAEAEYTALNTQEYADAAGVCELLFYSAALSVQSTFQKQGCTAPNTGSSWTISALANAFTSNLSQQDADAKAAAYITTLDTQANANLYGSCVQGQFYTRALSGNQANYRVYVAPNVGNWFQINGSNASPLTVPITKGAFTDFLVSQPTSNVTLRHDSQSQGAYLVNCEVYKNGVQVSANSISIPNTQGFSPFLSLPASSAGDLFFVRIF